MRVIQREPRVGRVEVVPGIRFPTNGVTVSVPEHKSGLALEIDVVPDGGRLVIDCVRASRGSNGQPVTLAALRTVALKPALALAMWEAEVRFDPSKRWGEEEAELATLRTGEHEGYYFWGLLDSRDRDRLKAQGPTDETLRWVALIYRVAVVLDQPPVRHLHEGFGVSLRTASNWVAAARAAGHLTDKEA